MWMWGRAPAKNTSLSHMHSDVNLNHNESRFIWNNSTAKINKNDATTTAVVARDSYELAVSSLRGPYELTGEWERQNTDDAVLRIPVQFYVDQRRLTGDALYSHVVRLLSL